MKKEVTDYVKSLGGSTNYSGKSKIMFITDPVTRIDKYFIESCIISKFGFVLPFKLKTN